MFRNKNEYTVPDPCEEAIRDSEHGTMGRILSCVFGHKIAVVLAMLATLVVASPSDKQKSSRSEVGLNEDSFSAPDSAVVENVIRQMFSEYTILVGDIDDYVKEAMIDGFVRIFANFNGNKRLALERLYKVVVDGRLGDMPSVIPIDGIGFAFSRILEGDSCDGNKRSLYNLGSVILLCQDGLGPNDDYSYYNDVAYLTSALGPDFRMLLLEDPKVFDGMSIDGGILRRFVVKFAEKWGITGEKNLKSLLEIFAPVSSNSYAKMCKDAGIKVKRLKRLLAKEKVDVKKFEAEISPHPEITKLISIIEGEFGIDVEFISYDSPSHASLYNPVYSDAKESLRIVVDVLSGYGKKFVKDAGIDRIILTRNLVNVEQKTELGGIAFVDDGNGVSVVSLDNPMNVASNAYHEFFHVLEESFKSAKKDPAWVRLNPNGEGDYVHDRGGDVKDGDFGPDGACGKNKAGFAYKYSYCGGYREDRAGTAEFLQSGGMGVVDRMIEDVALRAKAEMLTGCEFDIAEGRFIRVFSRGEYSARFGVKKPSNFATWSKGEIGPEYWNRRLAGE